jgi:pimeloyl-ACP methyl ester carboxylesterase
MSRSSSYRHLLALLAGSALLACSVPGAPGPDRGGASPPGEQTTAATADRSAPTGCKASLKGASASAAWCNRGSYFTWASTTTPDTTLQIYWGCAGDVSRPAIYMNHGFPTSSFDFNALVDDLSSSYRVCWLDTPGYGFSDKPAVYTYSIFEDAAIVDHFIRSVARLESFALLTHDKGDSVGLELLRQYGEKVGAGQDPGYAITQHFLLNGNIYLPLANLSGLQLSLLDPETGDEYADSLSGTQLALTLGVATYSPPLTARPMNDLAAVFDYQDGTSVMDSTVQYLNEREDYEDTWLEALANTSVPLTIIWGEKDTIAPTAVADYAWDHYVAPRTAPARYYRHPCANHYLPSDHAADVATIVRASMAGTTATFTPDTCAPYLKAQNP